MFWIGLGFGVMIGGAIGSTIMAAMNLAARADQQADTWHRRYGRQFTKVE